MTGDIRKFAQQHVAALAEPINDLVGRVIAKGLTGILEECCVLQRRVTELEAQLAERDAQQEKDAARYRFARDVGCNFVWAVIGAGECRSGLDEAIDARIAALSAQANQD